MEFGMTNLINHALSDEQVEVLDRALELAWHRFSKSDMDQHNLAEAQQILAQRIIDSTAEGERDPTVAAFNVRISSLPPATNCRTEFLMTITRTPLPGSSRRSRRRKNTYGRASA
jgi:hypothetical protein